jgi:hypothetical protein
MKLFFLIIIFSVFAVVFNSISTEAQTIAPGNGPASSKNQNSKTNTLDISMVDFKNFTFPTVGAGNVEKTFTLKNGESGKKGIAPYYALRKTYYFDLTGDKKDEAITHIIVEGCEMGCESSSLFYIHTTENKQPKLLWKIAVGGNTMGGLKAVNFKSDEIVLESFGDCSLEGWLIKPVVDVQKNPKLKTTSYTRFVFSRNENSFAQTARNVLPLTIFIDFLQYRPQITFSK